MFWAPPQSGAMFLTKATSLIWDGLLALAYPQRCAVCQKDVDRRHSGTVCTSCWLTTKVFSDEETICWKCGAPSLGVIEPEKKEVVRCRRCDNDAYTTARSCGAYDGALRASVLALKRDPNLSRYLLQLLVLRQRTKPLNQATRVVPVPLHPDREKERGFNQAAIIGEQLARKVRLPFDDQSLVRARHSERHRAGMDATGRRASVAGAFVVQNPLLVKHERILLVDDVFTTGATVSACAEALIAGGASEVYVLTIARALH